MTMSKPAPDAFLEAATRLKVEPSRAVVVGDAIAGVEAGRGGRFGSVCSNTAPVMSTVWRQRKARDFELRL